eukprot:3562603-Prymnesium_polylepis.1
MHTRRRADGPARPRPVRRISAPRAEHTSLMRGLTVVYKVRRLGACTLARPAASTPRVCSVPTP